MDGVSKDRSDLEAMSEVTNDRAEKWLQSVIDLCTHSLALTIDDPLYTVTYTTALGTSLYALDLTQNPPSKEGARNMDFEVVFPFLYMFEWNNWEEKNTEENSDQNRSIVSWTSACGVYAWIFTKSMVVYKSGWNHGHLSGPAHHEGKLKQWADDEHFSVWIKNNVKKVSHWFSSSKHCKITKCHQAPYRHPIGTLQAPFRHPTGTLRHP